MAGRVSQRLFERIDRGGGLAEAVLRGGEADHGVPLAWFQTEVCIEGVGGGDGIVAGCRGAGERKLSVG